MKQGTEGSIISGTLLTENLLPIFLDLLEILEHPAAGSMKAEYESGIDPDDQEFMLDEAMDFLDECAPEGCYFGAHTGDGADFGFWRCEEN